MILILMCVVLTAKADLLFDMYRETVDHTVSPCENFYRHACRLGSKNIDLRFYDVMKNQSYPFSKAFFARFNSTVLNDHSVLIDINIESNLEDVIEKQYYQWCESGEFDKIKYFSRKLFFNQKISKNTNCTTEAGNVKNVLIKREVNREMTRRAISTVFFNALGAGFDIISERDTFIRDIFEEMRRMILLLLEETPWAQNYDVIEQYRKVIQKMKVRPHFRGGKNIIRELKELEEKYLECNKKLESNTTELKLICFTLASFSSLLPEFNEPFSNALNRYNYLSFGPLFYYLSAGDGGRATNIGFTAQTIGHEFSHTLFDDNLDPQFSYFSKVAKNCVLKQFNATCNNYKEESCSMNDYYLEECGADMMGQRLGYEILKNQFNSHLHDLYPGTNATQQQLYFYGYAFHSCQGHLSTDYDGTHNADNIRVNSIVQLPEFQEAFNCPNDSKMMKTRTEECFFYGPQAPETKLRYHRR